jgi:hypothetical protein
MEDAIVKITPVFADNIRPRCQCVNDIMEILLCNDLELVRVNDLDAYYACQYDDFLTPWLFVI